MKATTICEVPPVGWEEKQESPPTLCLAGSLRATAAVTAMVVASDTTTAVAAAASHWIAVRLMVAGRHRRVNVQSMTTEGRRRITVLHRATSGRIPMTIGATRRRHRPTNVARRPPAILAIRVVGTTVRHLYAAATGTRVGATAGTGATSATRAIGTTFASPSMDMMHATAAAAGMSGAAMAGTSDAATMSARFLVAGTRAAVAMAARRCTTRARAGVSGTGTSAAATTRVAALDRCPRTAPSLRKGHLPQDTMARPARTRHRARGTPRAQL